jgi:hypothetical protein
MVRSSVLVCITYLINRFLPPSEEKQGVFVLVTAAFRFGVFLFLVFGFTFLRLIRFFFRKLERRKT